jgi:membrane fusion protein (multidrug efflux system)
MRFLRQVGWLAVISALGVTAYYGQQLFHPSSSDSQVTSKRDKGKAVAVETASASYRELSNLIEAVGSTRALRTVEITPLASGRVSKVDFSAGKLVKAGDVLLHLDDDIQRADLDEAKARLTDAVEKLNRSETLKNQNAIAQSTVSELFAGVAIARAEHDRALKRLQDRLVTAPFSGIVGFSSVELGARVEVGDVVTVLDDLSRVEVEFSLPEGLFGKIALGMPVTAHAASYPERVFNGKIDSINSRVDTISRSFKARAVVANDDRALPGGMFVYLAVSLDAEKALVVPEEAIVVDGNRSLIFVVKKDDEQQQHVERRYISVGRRTFGYAEVIKGIVEGEQVVVRGIQKVRDGTPVQIKESPASTAIPKKEAKG